MSERGSSRPEPRGDAARLLLASARARFSAAASDFLLPQQARLTEWQRLTAAALLLDLVGGIEGALRAALAAAFADHEALHAALSSPRVAIALPILDRAEALRDADLGIVLVRRVEEHRYWKDNESADLLLTALAGDADPALAADATALLVARSRRFDRFQEPMIGHSDLPAELHHRLVWIVAAALRHYVVQHHAIASGVADGAIAGAAAAMVAGYDEGGTLEACTMRLAARLLPAGRLEGSDLAAMLEEGMLPLFLAGIAARCGLDYAAAWEILSDPEGRGSALLLRAARIGREDAALILLLLNARGQLFSSEEGDAAAAQLAAYDATDAAAAIDVLRLWQVDPGYRAAIGRLSTRRRSASEAA